MRPELLAPRKLTDEVLLDTLALAGVALLPEHIAAWTGMERHLASDWAARVHMRAADNLTKVRDKPSFVTAAEMALAEQRFLDWPVELENQGDGPDCCGDDLAVICGAAVPGERVNLPCRVRLSTPHTAGQLLEEIRKHAVDTEHAA